MIYNNFSVLPYPGHSGQAFVILDGVVLDVTGYLEAVTNVVRVAKDAYSRAFATERMFLPLDLTILLFTNIGNDITEDFYQQTPHSDQMRDCMYTLFFHGVIPTEKYDGCDRINPALWATMGAFLLYFLFKINLANLSRVPLVQRFLFKSTPDYTPLSRWPYTLLFIPCYSESSVAIRQTLDSLARTSHPDDRKLLVFVCDGVVKSATDSKENYRSVLDALGYSSTKDPDPRPYVSLGMGSRRVNYAKVYAGFYESGGNRVPFLLIVKVGSSKEVMSGRSPGNRGKRDSMVIVLGFLERCMNLAHNRITPLEFELFNQCYNLLGIDPRLLKYMLVTDADTQVQADVVHKMIVRLEQDPKMLAVNGYVRPANPEENIITMLQIFPNYLTFYSGLAYEACLSSVTTLNGGFVMYRLWSDTKPSIIKSQKHKSHDNIKLQRIHDDHQKWSKVSDEVVSEVEDNDGQRHTTLSFLPNPAIRPVCIHPTVLRGFATPQPNTLHMENVLLLGEEQYFGIVLLKSHPQHRLGFEPEAVAYATLPTNYFALQALQIRNIRATFHIQIEFQHIAKHLGVMYWFVSITKVVDTVLAMPIIVNLYGIFIRYFIYKNLAYGIISASFTALVVLHMFYFVIRRQFKYIIWFSLYCLFSVPLFTVFFPILAAWCSDYSNRWYDVWPTSKGYHGRIHGIVDDSNTDTKEIADREEDQVIRMRLYDFEIVEAERQNQREKEQAAMLDAKFNGFGNYVSSSSGEYRSKPSVSSFERGLIVPPAAQLKEVNYYANKKPILDDDIRLPRSSPNDPFTSVLDDPFDDLPPQRRHKQTQSQSSFFSRSSYNSDPVQGADSTFRSSMFSSSGGFPTTSSHARSHSASSSIVHPSNTYFESDLRYSSSPTHSLTNSIISLERDGECQNHITGGGPIHILTSNGNKINRYHQATNYRLDETAQGRNAPIHSRITRPPSWHFLIN
jgi:hypothetical protein